MSGGSIDDELRDEGPEELWDLDEELLIDGDENAQVVVAAEQAEAELGPEEAARAIARRRLRRRRPGVEEDEEEYTTDHCGPPSWRVIEMRREQRDLDDFLREVYDD